MTYSLLLGGLGLAGGLGLEGGCGLLTTSLLLSDPTDSPDISAANCVQLKAVRSTRSSVELSHDFRLEMLTVKTVRDCSCFEIFDYSFCHCSKVKLCPCLTNWYSNISTVNTNNH